MQRLLLINDSDADYQQYRELLASNDQLFSEINHAISVEAAKDRFLLDPHDVYLIDISPDESAMELVRDANRSGCDGPIILVLEDYSEAMDKKAIELGAADVLPKGELSGALILRAIRHANERKRSKQKLAFLATHDSLTEAPNRTLLNKHLVRGLAKSSRTHNKLAVLFIGIDRFQMVNDSLGHDVGDQLLRLFSQRLQSISRTKDTVARIGGDEFIQLIEDVKNPQQVKSIANKIIQSMSMPFHFGGHELYLSASIGIAMYPDDGETPEILLKNADSALHQAKDNGRNTHTFYNASMNGADFSFIELGRELRHALIGKQFHIFYQPQIDIKTQQVVGAEALLRWHHPSKGWIGPDQFIPIVEDCGLMTKLGEWIIRSVAKQISQWQSAGIPDIRIAINVSGKQLKETNLKRLLQEVIAYHNIKPQLLELELTESILIENVDQNNELLSDIRSLGIHLAIDDFGTGYSSLSYLKHFPINVLKIDQCFVKNMMTDACDRAIVESLINLAHKIKLKVIAEGVETKQQLVLLSNYGCDEIQGYLFSKPLEAQAFSDYLCQYAQAGSLDIAKSISRPPPQNQHQKIS